MVTEYKIEYNFDPETRFIAAVVPALNYISSFGATFAEAEKHITEAIEAYLEALIKENAIIPKETFLTSGTFVKISMAPLNTP
jgi:predicted RNase H-like HicB family nuclease